ncbi:rod shape-determining protein MreC [Pontibacillus yanchengensis]|uniref:Rod shape-determining protein MreC n=2 Tax=Pontibacillus yanchengensis TaxID=462910 RepID=A0ACC7VF84_9BACI|nr:rod shape-determining protein MreC [Pontibacillus yanchengensis]MYL33314.1 rod shape-determining protein MreC [Pontibacillus yanchengensis]MYL53362.1 rod shape-determining protein MreC [Pontibacillus yanchengensis]
MPSFFRNKRLILILISIILLVALIGFTMRDRDNLTWPEEFLQDTIGGVQTVFHTPVQFVTGIYDNIKDIRQTYEQNQMLKARVSEFKDLLIDVKQLKKDNEELRKLLDKQENMSDYEEIPATVIARSPEPRWFKQLTINKGKRHGVKANMAVITGDGLVGKIQSTSAVTSTVQLLSGFDRSNVIHGVILGGEDDKDQYGLIEAPDDKQKDALLLKKIPYEAKIEKGQTVVSSGMGGVFPKGLLIGKIEKVVIDEYGLTQTAYVEPAADLYDINHVSVVDRASYSPSLDEPPSTSKEEDSE